MEPNFFNIVLFSPDIPQNTGNIARFCAANELKLHLIEPLGFSLDEREVKRAALDYWQHVDLVTYKNWDDFVATNGDERLWLLTSKCERSYWDADFKPGDFLIFGSETSGLPDEIMQSYADRQLTVPMSSVNVRCLNLASTAQTVYYEAARQNSLSPVP